MMCKQIFLTLSRYFIKYCADVNIVLKYFLMWCKPALKYRESIHEYSRTLSSDLDIYCC